MSEVKMRLWRSSVQPREPGQHEKPQPTGTVLVTVVVQQGSSMEPLKGAFSQPVFFSPNCLHSQTSARPCPESL